MEPHSHREKKTSYIKNQKVERAFSLLFFPSHREMRHYRCCLYAFLPILLFLERQMPIIRQCFTYDNYFFHWSREEKNSYLRLGTELLCPTVHTSCPSSSLLTCFPYAYLSKPLQWEEDRGISLWSGRGFMPRMRSFKIIRYPRIETDMKRKGLTTNAKFQKE